MKLNLTWVGQPKDVQTKFGTKQKFSVKATQYGDNYLDVWSSPVTRNWKTGDEVEVLSVDTREYQGKTYYDVKMPKANSLSPETQQMLEKILTNVTKINLKLDYMAEKLNLVKKEPAKIPGTNEDYPLFMSEPNFDNDVAF
jgi:hypothetical protein